MLLKGALTARFGFTGQKMWIMLYAAILEILKDMTGLGVNGIGALNVEVNYVKHRTIMNYIE